MMELAVLLDTTAKLVVLMAKPTVEFLDSAELLDGKEAAGDAHFTDGRDESNWISHGVSHDAN